MTWRSQAVLWLLVLGPVAAGLLIAARQLRTRQLRAFGSEQVLGSLIRGDGGRLRLVRAALLVTGLMLLVVALAGPQYGTRTRLLRKRGVDLVVALDFSKSMLARDVRPSRIERVTAELRPFLRNLEGDRVGLVAFAGDALEFPMTVDHAALHLFLRDLGPADMPVGGTSIARALRAAGHLLERAGNTAEGTRKGGELERTRVVLLITDGEDHEGDPLTVAEELAARGIRLYVVGIGSRGGAPIPETGPDGSEKGYIRDEAGKIVMSALTSTEEQTLRKLAQTTGGIYVSADRESLGLKSIQRQMRKLKQHELAARQVAVHEARYALVLLPAFLLLVLEAILPEAWLRRRKRRKP